MFGDGFHPAAHVHFLADVFGVSANGFGGNVQLVANLFVNKSFGKQIEHFAFPPRQVFRLAFGRSQQMEMPDYFPRDVSGQRRAAIVDVTN